MTSGAPRPRTTLAHITDAHVTPQGRRTAVLKDLSGPILADLLEQVGDADAVAFGGDNIDNHGSGEADLELFFHLTKRLPRWLCIPGNHEADEGLPGSGNLSKLAFARAVTGHGIGVERTCFSERVGNVRLIGIDTTLVGTVGGFVSKASISFLARELRSADEDHVVVMGHHLLAAPWAPYRLDVWEKDYLIANREEISSLLASCPKVRAYLCGHHHASHIHRIGGRGASGGFYHILTPSPAAYPHGARILRFEPDALVVSTIRPRLPGVLEAGAEAVLSGRKARRFETLGTSLEFGDYLAGGPGDNDVTLPFGTPAYVRPEVEQRA